MTRLTESVTLETLRRFDRPGPRYTSYPTAVEFHDGVGESEYQAMLGEADRSGPDTPLSLYIHIPFCEHKCHFCACHVVATQHLEVAARYLEYLEREITMIADLLPHRRMLAQMHWGGGTPTYFSPSQIERLYRHILGHFTLQDGAEIAIEVDPRVTSREHLNTLGRLGFNRLSLGVQDFSPTVQEAIGRGQTFEETKELVLHAREIGFVEGINFDLIYGLPRQSLEPFNASLDRVLELRPDRLAVYSFAFVPWIKSNQRRLRPEDFPKPALKLELYLTALDRFFEAGYEPIGMDHFSLPDDELAVAAREGRLERNFMGYTVKPVSTMIGCGVSSIGDLVRGYFQNCKKLSTYYEALDEARLPIERGCILDDDDQVRRYVIMNLMCNFGVDKEAVSRRFAIDFDTYFHSSILRLAEMEEAGFVRNETRAVKVTGTGKLFVRNAAMAFDRYLEEKTSERPVFSSTV
ncbi:MAG: oxygen-independent coproporphyrinogen III oxidase [Acidobacteria bacterium]|nr:oxygen-independent coproporphyrinogen III oxidase [Acidobacteriota bacterium]